MTPLAELLAWDRSLFWIINQAWYHPWLAELLRWSARDEVLLAAALMAIGVGFIAWGIKTTLLHLAWVFPGVAATKLLHDWLLKPWFDRPRPWESFESLRLLAPLGNLDHFSSSFPSTHSAMAACAAAIFSSREPRGRILFWALAWAVALGTVLAGGHYPGDALAGMVVGSLLGRGMLGLPAFWNRWRKILPRHR
jgi:undecaprenyl-diphosphatase